MMRVLLCLFIILKISSVYAGTLACSHTELCKLVDIIASENHLQNLKTQGLIYVSGDPHEYEPSTAEIKSLLSAPILLTGPNELNPWIKKINFQRSKNPALKTISLLFQKKHFDFYPKASGEALSHFWLYPKIYCSFKEQLEVELKKINEAVMISRCDPTSVEKELAQALTKINKPIILTHDALLPLLSGLDPAHMIVAIKGSGHHEETSTDAIKKMYKALEAPSAVWIIENSINVPQNILSKVRSSDIVIKIDTANSSGPTPFSIIKELTSKFKIIGEKK